MPGILFRDEHGQTVMVDVVDSGTVNGYGNKLYQLRVAHSAQTVSPVNQTSTSSFVDFAGSTLDSLSNTTLSYTLLNKDGANGLSWQVLAANAADFSDSVVAQASSNIAAAAVGTYTTNPALYRYYKVQVKDQVAASHAASQLRGIARG